MTAAPALSTWDGHRTFETPLALEYGLTDAWQVELGWSPQPLQPERANALEAAAQDSWLDVGAGLPVTRYDRTTTVGLAVDASFEIELGDSD